MNFIENTRSILKQIHQNTVSIQETRPKVNITCSQKSAIYNVMAYSVLCCYLANSGFKEYKSIYTYVYINASENFKQLSLLKEKGSVLFVIHQFRPHFYKL